MDDGAETEIGPGEAVAIPPGHDAEVVGEEPCVFIDFGEISEYAKRHEEMRRLVQATVAAVVLALALPAGAGARTNWVCVVPGESRRR